MMQTGSPRKLKQPLKVIRTLRRRRWQNFRIFLHAFHEFVTEHGEGQDVFGLIHSDLEPHNIIISDGQPSPIDVMEFGFGYYLSDMLTLSRHFNEDEQPIFFEGYQEIRPLPTDYRQQLALFEALHRL